MIKIPNGLAELKATYGDPSKYLHDLPGWEKKILRTKRLPTTLFYSDGITAIKSIRAHDLVVDDIIDALIESLDNGVDKKALLYAGCYNFRLKRNLAKLSIHCWALGPDLNPTQNPQGKKWDGGIRMMSPVIITSFTSHGAEWGGTWKSKPDCMHFQFVTGY